MQSEAGTLLIEGGLIGESQLRQALSITVADNSTLIQTLIRLGFVSDQQLASFFATRLQIPLAEEAQFANLPAFITRLIPVDVVMSHRTVPVMLHQGVLHVAISDPTNRAAMEEISFITGYSASPVSAPDGLIEAAMARYYGIPPEDGPLPSLLASQTRSIKSGRYSLISPRVTSQDPPESSTFAQAPSLAVETVNEALSQLETQPQAEPDALQAQALPEEAEFDRPRTDPNLVVVGPASDELEELFGMGRKDQEVIHLVHPKKARTATSITDAIRLQVDHDTGHAAELPADLVSAGDASRPTGTLEQPPALVDETTPEPLTTAQADEPDRTFESFAEKIETGLSDGPLDEGLSPLRDAEEVRYLIHKASERDEVARALVRYSRAFMPRVALFIVRKDFLVGWLGTGAGVGSRLVKGIMIPLNSPSVFRTVRETATDYFGSLPRTTVNDIFLAALGDIRPRQVLLIPVTVRHKPICILYGDCGTEPGFTQDLSGIHLIAQDASGAFEQIILQRKLNRLVNR